MRQLSQRRIARTLGTVTILALGLVAGVARASPADGGPAGAAVAAEKPFLDENAVAMDRMMAGMDARPTGDVSRDFVAMMIPHHQGAIDMAQAYLRHGQNEQLRRVAQEIIVEQQQEIAAMDLAIGAPLPASAPAPTGAAATAGASTGIAHHHQTSTP
jgi:uncharacterized protein (DUF305 family)